MQTKDLIARLVRFENWINLETLKSVEPLAAAGKRPLELLAHLLISQLNRLNTLEGISGKTEWWPQGEVQECRKLTETAARRWDIFLAGLTTEKLAEKLSWKTSAGTAVEASRLDLILHLIIHSAHHRGQIATLVREAGGEPARASLIAYALANP